MTPDEYIIELEENLRSIIVDFVYVMHGHEASEFHYKKSFIGLMLKNIMFELNNLDDEARNTYEKMLVREGSIESEETRAVSNGNIVYVDFGKDD